MQKCRDSKTDPLLLLCVGGLEPTHPRDEVSLRRLHQQVVVIRHQNERMHLPTSPTAHLAERVEKRSPISIIADNRLAMIAAVKQMINRVGELYACFPGHERS